jgi:hypothetical protein
MVQVNIPELIIKRHMRSKTIKFLVLLAQLTESMLINEMQKLISGKRRERILRNMVSQNVVSDKMTTSYE